MTTRHKRSATPERLRAQAEQLLARTPREVAQMPVEDVQKLVHELQVHQIELEMQNDELLRTQLELEAAVERYTDLYDFAPTAFLTLDGSGRITAANLAAGSLLDSDRKNLISEKFTRFIPAEAQDDFYLHQRQVLSSKEISAYGLNMLTAKGRRMTVQLQGAATQSPKNRKTELRFALIDLTERKRTEEALRRSEHHLSNFFEHSPIGMEWLSASGAILRANQSQLNLLGYPAPEYLGRSFGDFCVEPAVGIELLKRLAANETVRNFRVLLRNKGGTVLHVLVDGVSFWSEGQFQYSSIFTRDITYRVNLERELLHVSEWEHRRIAQDLHDGLGQLLVGTIYLTSMLRPALAAKSPSATRSLNRILKLLNEAVAQTRGLAHGLHPVEPEHNGLMVALGSLAKRTKTLFQIPCRFICRRPVLIKDNAVATHLYRIAQEAITNAIKHGKPTRIEISLTETPERIILAVKDNGAGMPARPRKKPSMGLRIMRYRAGVIGGSLGIQKEAGGGTAVVCTVHQPGGGRQRPDRAGHRKKVLI
jgi:PAS domain S-box-containing protein